MYIKTEIDDLADFEAWSGGEHTKCMIVNACLGTEFIEALEEHYPEGVTESELNDLLWFEDEWCYELVGLNSHGVTPLSGSDVLGYTCVVEDAIESKIEEYNKEHGTEYTADELGISAYDFESNLDDWLSENQEDDTDEDYLAERWLEDDGDVLIEEAIEDAAPNIPEADDHKHGDDDE
jgi:hypothetical protein